MMEKMSEARPGRVSIGTTSRGIGPCYEDKSGRAGMRLADLLAGDSFRAQYDALMEEKQRCPRRSGSTKPLDFDQIRAATTVFRRAHPPDGVRHGAVCWTARFATGGIVLFEGAQGTMLDIDHGTYPFVTSSSASAGGACTGTGVPPTRIRG